MNKNEPAVVVVPVISPVEGFKLNPSGKAPETIEYVNDIGKLSASVAVTVVLTESPILTSAIGEAFEVVQTGAKLLSTVIEKALSVFLSPSDALIVKL